MDLFGVLVTFAFYSFAAVLSYSLVWHIWGSKKFDDLNTRIYWLEDFVNHPFTSTA